MDIGDTPISPMMIEDDYTPVFLSLEVVEAYKRLVEIINIPEEGTTTIASHFPDEVKTSEYIRDAGLNLSLQDFVSYESLYQYFTNNPNVKTAQTVVMYNEEMAMISKENSSLNRLVVLMDKTTGEEIYVSSKEEFN